MAVNLTERVGNGDVLEWRNDGVVDRFHGGHIITREQEVTDILELNAAERNGDRLHGFRIAPTFRKVASIPVAAVDIAAAQGLDLLGDPEAMRHFLNAPETGRFARPWRGCDGSAFL